MNAFEIKAVNDALANIAQERMRIEQLQLGVDRALKNAKPVTDAEAQEMTRLQARADTVYLDHDMRAPPPMPFEHAHEFRRRLLGALQKHSPRWKDGNLGIMPDEILDEIEPMIFADASEAAKHPADGELRCREEKSGAVTFNKFYGHPNAWMNEFAGPVRQFVTAWNSRGNPFSVDIFSH